MNYEEKAKRYDEALERMKSWAKGEHPECFSEAQKAAEFIFPELKEHWDEGERIRKALYADIRTYIPNERGDKYIAWLEKQRDYDRLIEEMKKRKELLSKEKEKATSANDKLSLGRRIAMLQELLAFNICNTADKVEPKFKVGDWIVRGKSIVQISDIQGQYYIGIDIYGNDLTLKDRKRYYYLEDISLCNESCHYINVNYTNQRFICECEIVYNSRLHDYVWYIKADNSMCSFIGKIEIIRFFLGNIRIKCRFKMKPFIFNICCCSCIFV